jgi:hypothetical protein
MDIKVDKPADVESPRGHNPLYIESTDNNVPALFAAHGGGEAIHAHNRSANMAAIAAYNLNSNSNSAAIFAKKEGSNGHAGFFVGDVWVDRNLGVRGLVQARGLRTEDSIYIGGGVIAEKWSLAKAGMRIIGDLEVFGRIREYHPVAADDPLPESQCLPEFLSKSESLSERIRRLEEEVADLRSRLTSGFKP